MARKRYTTTISDVPEENFKNPPNPKVVELSDAEKAKLEKEKAELYGSADVQAISLEALLTKAIRDELRKG